MDDVITKLTSKNKSSSRKKEISQDDNVSNVLNSSTKTYSENNTSDELYNELSARTDDIQVNYFKWTNLLYILSAFIMGYVIMNIIMSFEYITQQINHYLGNLFNTSVDVTEKGVEGTTDIVDDALHGNMNTLNKMIDNNITKNNIDNKNIIQEPAKEEGDDSIMPVNTVDNEPVKAVQKKGYCYVGTDRGYRSCIKVGDSEKCMSGDIFPSKNICINPSLRE